MSVCLTIDGIPFRIVLDGCCKRLRESYVLRQAANKKKAPKFSKFYFLRHNNGVLISILLLDRKNDMIISTANSVFFL